MFVSIEVITKDKNYLETPRETQVNSSIQSSFSRTLMSKGVLQPPNPLGSVTDSEKN